MPVPPWRARGRRARRALADRSEVVEMVVSIVNVEQGAEMPAPAEGGADDDARGEDEPGS